MLVKPNEKSLNVKFIWISSHPQKWGKSRVLAKHRVFGGKTGFTFHCPSKPRCTHKPEKFPGFGGIGCVNIYICVCTYKYTYVYMYICIYVWHWINNVSDKYAYMWGKTTADIDQFVNWILQVGGHPHCDWGSVHPTALSSLDATSKAGTN